MIPQSKLKPSDFANWINSATDRTGKHIEWNYWCTFTTGYSMSLNSARRAMERFYNVLGDDRGGLLWCAEPFDTKEGFHTHGVLKTHFDFEWQREAWQIASGAKYRGGFNRIQILPYKPKLGGAFYVAKYVGKRLSDWDIHTNLNDTATTERPQKNEKRHKPIYLPNIDSINNSLEYSPPIKLLQNER